MIKSLSTQHNVIRKIIAIRFIKKSKISEKKSIPSFLFNFQLESTASGHEVGFEIRISERIRIEQSQTSTYVVLRAKLGSNVMWERDGNPILD